MRVFLRLGQSVNKAAQYTVVSKAAVRFSHSVGIHGVLSAFFTVVIEDLAENNLGEIYFGLWFERVQLGVHRRRLRLCAS